MRSFDVNDALAHCLTQTVHITKAEKQQITSSAVRKFRYGNNRQNHDQLDRQKIAAKSLSK